MKGVLNSYLANLLAVHFKGVLWANWGFVDHLQCDWDKDLVLSHIILLISATVLLSTSFSSIPSVSTTATIAVSTAASKESRIVVSEL